MFFACYLSIPQERFDGAGPPLNPTAGSGARPRATGEAGTAPPADGSLGRGLLARDGRFQDIESRAKGTGEAAGPESDVTQRDSSISGTARERHGGRSRRDGRSVQAEGACIVNIVVPQRIGLSMFVGEVIQQVTLGNGRQCDRVADIRRSLDSKAVDLVVFATPLKQKEQTDSVNESLQPSLGVLLRNLTWSIKSGKDVYVSSTRDDRVVWKPDGDPAGPPQGTEEFFKMQPNHGNDRTVDAAIKYARLASYGGVDWEDFGAFLKCVKSRAEPPNSIKRSRLRTENK